MAQSESWRGGQLQVVPVPFAVVATLAHELYVAQVVRAVCFARLDSVQRQVAKTGFPPLQCTRLPGDISVISLVSVSAVPSSQYLA